MDLYYLCPSLAALDFAMDGRLKYPRSHSSSARADPAVNSLFLPCGLRGSEERIVGTWREIKCLAFALPRTPTVGPPVLPSSSYPCHQEKYCRVQGILLAFSGKVKRLFSVSVFADQACLVPWLPLQCNEDEAISSEHLIRWAWACKDFQVSQAPLQNLEMIIKQPVSAQQGICKIMDLW